MRSRAAASVTPGTPGQGLGGAGGGLGSGLAAAGPDRTVASPLSWRAQPWAARSAAMAPTAVRQARKQRTAITKTSQRLAARVARQQRRRGGCSRRDRSCVAPAAAGRPSRCSTGAPGARDQVLVVAGDQHGGAQPVQSTNSAAAARAISGSTLPVGSSAQDQVGPGHHGAGDGQPLLLAARQGRRQGVHPVARGRPRPAARPRRRRSRSACRPARRSGRATLSKAERWSSRRKSWNTTPMRRRKPGRSRRGAVAASSPNRLQRCPCRDARCKVRQLQQGRLPRPGRPGKEVERAGWQGEVNVPQRAVRRRIAEPDASEADGVGRGVGFV